MIAKGKLLRLLRESIPMQQQEAADKIGMAAAYLSLIESGKKSPRLSTLEKLCELYQVPVVLFDFDENWQGHTEAEQAIHAKIVAIYKELLFMILARNYES